MSESEVQEGVQWPEKSTTAVNKRIFAACTAAMQEAGVEGAADLAAVMEGEKDWRHKYHRHLGLMAEMMAASPEAAVAQATAGLEAVAKEFKYVRGGETSTLKAAVMGQGLASSAVETVRVEGTGAAGGIEVPVDVKGRAETVVLQGSDLVEQAKAWADYGAGQSSVAESIEALTKLSSADIKAALDKRVFCLIGGTSELCPARPLLKLGATVAAIARPGSKLEDLRSFAEGTAGTLLLPKIGDRDAGLDLMTQAPEVCDWLESLAKDKANAKRSLCVGSYVYLDGELNVRVSAVVDAIWARLQEILGNRFEMSLLASPGTAHLWPAEAAKAAAEAWKSRPFWSRLAGVKPNVRSYDPEAPPKVFNGHLVMQGPNYALAQTMRLWRCVLARKSGCRVSANMTPACRTQSMTKSAAMRILLDGAQGIKPLLILQAQTCSHFMGALLLCDLVAKGTPADPSATLQHPWELFVHNALDGGVWACPFSQDSLTIAVGIMGKLHFYPGTAALVCESDKKGRDCAGK